MNDTSIRQNLDNFLRRIHLGSEVYYVGQLCDAWHMSTPGGRERHDFPLGVQRRGMDTYAGQIPAGADACRGHCIFSA